MLGLRGMVPAMALNAQRGGLLTVMSKRTPARTSDLLALGAIEAESAADAARGADISFAGPAPEPVPTS